MEINSDQDAIEALRRLQGIVDHAIGYDLPHSLTERIDEAYDLIESLIDHFEPSDWCVNPKYYESVSDCSPSELAKELSIRGYAVIPDKEDCAVRLKQLVRLVKTGGESAEKCLRSVKAFLGYCAPQKRFLSVETRENAKGQTWVYINTPESDQVTIGYIVGQNTPFLGTLRQFGIRH